MTTESQSAALHFTTDAFAPHEKVAAWREIYGKRVDLDFEPAAPAAFSGDATMRTYPGLRIGSVGMAQVAYSKVRNHTPSDDILLTIIESGRLMSTRRDICLQPGDAVLRWTVQDMDGQFNTHCEGRQSLIRIPTAAIAPLVGDISASVNRRIPAATDTLRLLRPYARAVMDCSTTPALQQLAARHVSDLIAMMCGASGEAAQIVRNRGGQAARLRAIKDDIEQNLAHGDVSLAAVAARHRMSPRYLQKLFDSEDTTFSEYVLIQRLAHAHRLLTDPGRATEKIAAIAFAAGFGDVSYFYRAFRRRYDVLPTDLRAVAQRTN